MKHKRNYWNKIALLTTAFTLLAGFGPASAQAPADGPKYKALIKVLDKPALDTLLAKRLNGSLGQSFGAFSNMFFVRSKLDTDTCVGLVPGTKEMSEEILQPAFPSTYKPTLRELLDTIATEVGAHWNYESANQFLMGDKPHGEITDKIVKFDFLEGAAKMPFEITPAKGWKAVPRHGWIMYVPPIAPMAMDLIQCGRLSKSSNNDQCVVDAPTNFALDSLRRARPTAAAKDLSKVKVGQYDAVFFEQQLPASGEAKIRWRQWHFMVGNQLCYIISTIKTEQDAQLYPDVLEMIKSFKTEPVELTTWRR